MIEYTLKKPIALSDDTKLERLALDFEKLTTADFRAAQKLKSLVTDGRSVDASKLVSVLRLDPEFQIAVAFVAACKATPGLTQMDFLKLNMIDAMCIGEIANDAFFE